MPKHSALSLRWFSVAIALLLNILIIALVTAAESSTIHIRIDAGDITENLVHQQGYLHGFSDVDYQPASLNMKLLMPLQPSFWRIGFSGNFGQNYQLAKTLNPNAKITLVLSDLLAMRYGGYGKLQPWRDWARYERDVQEIVRSVRSTGYRIDYWDVWSEPDVKGFWSGNCQQAMELFKRTHDVLRAEMPDAKIIGPSISAFDAKGACKQPFLSTFVEFASLNKLHFNALAWHEFGHPREVAAHVAIVRQHFSERPALSMPEIHVNEYSGPAGHGIPGLAVHWLHALENARVDWSSRACWEKQCESGLNGLFKPDNQTPSPVYWVYRAYAEMSVSRLGTQVDSEQVAAIASLDKDRKKSTLLVGTDTLIQQGGRQLKIRVDNYPFLNKNTRVVIKRIAKESTNQVNEIGVPARQSIKNGNLSFWLDNVVAGDAYWIEITDSSSN